MPEPITPSRASAKLDRILDEKGPLAARLKREISRSVLWRLRTGRRCADLDTAIAVRRITRGQIREADWRTPLPTARRSPKVRE